jgi:predicted component of type VI protein secretion system
MGDFSGRGGRETIDSGARLAERAALKVDIDNFEDVLARLAPRIELPPVDEVGPLTTVTVDRLEDFHPDALYDTLPFFADLRDLHRRLMDSATFAAAAAELRLDASGSDERDVGAAPDDDGDEGDGAALDRLPPRA